MSISRDDSQQTTCNIITQAEDGARVCIALATCTLRPGKGMSFTVDVYDRAAIEKNIYAVRETIADYIKEEFLKAQEFDIPVSVPT